MAHDFNKDSLTMIKRRKTGKIKSILKSGSRPVLVSEYDEKIGGWRQRIVMTRRKMGEEEKGAFLQEYMKWGRIGEAAAVAGVSINCAKDEMERDPIFAEAVLAAEEHYRDKLIRHHQNLVFNGTERTSFDRNGNISSIETIYPIRLIEMELKKHDSGYREKQEVAVTHSGGVMVAPAEMATIEDWRTKYGPKDITLKDDDDDRNTIEGTIVADK